MKQWLLDSASTQDDWVALVKKELKTDDIKRLLERPLPEGGHLPMLAQNQQSWFDASFKRAALSYTWTRESEVDWKRLPDFVGQGVWDFILDPMLLGWDDKKLQSELSLAAPILKSTPARLWVCSDKVLLPSGAFQVISASDVVAQGGHAVHEMALLLTRLIDWGKTNPTQSIAVAVTLDREFFKSIAKKRAMKALVEAAFKEMECVDLLSRITWMARSSWRDFTGYDSGNNMLRNATAVAAAYIVGAGVVESLPSDLLIEASTADRAVAARLATTTQLVLQNESQLGEVADPASGGFAVEHLTRTLGEETWKLMQQLISLSGEERWTQLAPAVTAHWQEQQKKFTTRRLVQTGVNDFPNALEEIKFTPRFLRDDHVRLGRGFEELRQSLPKQKPTVAVAVVGDYAALQARLNFTKNYFELLGLHVVESGKGLAVAEAHEWLQREAAPVTAWVSKDEDHAQLKSVGSRCYVAGKTPVEGCLNIFAGQDVLQVLKELSTWWRAQA